MLPTQNYNLWAIEFCSIQTSPTNIPSIRTWQMYCEVWKR